MDYLHRVKKRIDVQGLADFYLAKLRAFGFTRQKPGLCGYGGLPCADFLLI